MSEKVEFVLRTILIGVGTTVVMDAWAFLLRQFVFDWDNVRRSPAVDVRLEVGPIAVFASRAPHWDRDGVGAIAYLAAGIGRRDRILQDCNSSLQQHEKPGHTYGLWLWPVSRCSRNSFAHPRRKLSRRCDCGGGRGIDLTITPTRTWVLRIKGAESGGRSHRLATLR